MPSSFENSASDISLSHMAAFMEAAIFLCISNADLPPAIRIKKRSPKVKTSLPVDVPVYRYACIPNESIILLYTYFCTKIRQKPRQKPKFLHILLFRCVK